MVVEDDIHHWTYWSWDNNRKFKRGILFVTFVAQGSFLLVLSIWSHGLRPERSWDRRPWSWQNKLTVKMSSRHDRDSWIERDFNSQRNTVITFWEPSYHHKSSQYVPRSSLCVLLRFHSVKSTCWRVACSSLLWHIGHQGAFRDEMRDWCMTFDSIYVVATRAGPFHQIRSL